jgi:hypothetical protein
MSNPESISTALFEVAIHQLLINDTKPIDELIQRRNVLTLPARDLALSIELFRIRTEGGRLDLLRPRLRAASREDLITRLDQIEEQDAGFSPGWWKCQWDDLCQPIQAERLQRIAEDLTRRRISAAAALAEITEALKDESHVLEENIFDHMIWGDPDKEPKIELPPAWIAGVLYSGLVNIAGTRKSSKTWWAMLASICIQAGIPFLGRPVRQGRVAWIQKDMPAGLFLHYAKMLRVGMYLPNTEIDFYSHPKIDLNLLDHQRKLAAKLKDRGTELVFIDSGRASFSVEENESDSVSKITRGFLCHALRDTGIDVALILHAAKNGMCGGSRGSGEWDASADSILSFSRPREDADEFKICGVGRHARFDVSFAVDDLKNLEGGGDGVLLREIEECGNQTQQKERKDPTESVEDYMRTTGEWYSLRQLTDGVHIRFKSVQLAIDQLLDKGLIETANHRWRFRPECRGNL